MLPEFKHSRQKFRKRPCLQLATGITDIFFIHSIRTGSMSRIHFIGGEKGGIGKSIMSRLLALST